MVSHADCKRKDLARCNRSISVKAVLQFLDPAISEPFLFW